MVQPVQPIISNESSLHTSLRNGHVIYTIEDKQKRMAKQEIHRRMGNPIAAAWWKFMPGTTITVKWPAGICIDGTDSSDPNDHYRAELEAAVGKQGRDWDWRVSDDSYKLTIKVRNTHAAWATMALLKWG